MPGRADTYPMFIGDYWNTRNQQTSFVVDENTIYTWSSVQACAKPIAIKPSCLSKNIKNDKQRPPKRAIFLAALFTAAAFFSAFAFHLKAPHQG